MEQTSMKRSTGSSAKTRRGISPQSKDTGTRGVSGKKKTKKQGLATSPTQPSTSCSSTTSQENGSLATMLRISLGTLEMWETNLNEISNNLSKINDYFGREWISDWYQELKDAQITVSSLLLSLKLEVMYQKHLRDLK